MDIKSGKFKSLEIPINETKDEGDEALRRLCVETTEGIPEIKEARFYIVEG